MLTSRSLLDVPYTQLDHPSSSYVLNHEAIALLVAHTLRLQKEQSFVLAGPEDLRALLPKLQMHAEGDEAFILFRPYIHSMAIYMRYEAEQVQIYYFDSQNWGFRYYPTRLAIACIQEHYPTARIVLSGNPLQFEKSNEGCTQYSLYFLEYCVTHGRELLHRTFNEAQSSTGSQLIQQSADELPEELKAIAMSVNPKWYEAFRVYNHQQLDSILVQYADADGQLDWERVFETVQHLQGVNLPELSPKMPTAGPSPFHIYSHKTKLYIKWNTRSSIPKDDYLYSNCLLYSAKKYPAQVKPDELACVFDGIPEIRVIRDTNQYAVTLKVQSTAIMERVLKDLLQHKELLWRKQMRQWNGFQALISELQQALALHTICQNQSGGLTQYQVQLALRNALAKQRNVYVPSIDMLAGHAAALSMNALYANHFRYVAFSYQSTAIHQIAVWVILGEDNHEVVVYDSWETMDVPSTLEANLRHLLCLKEHDRVRAESSIYPQQTDDWSCGVHAWATLTYLANTSNLQPESQICNTSAFDAMHAAKVLYACYKKQEVLDAPKEAEKTVHQQRTGILLAAIEEYRHAKGHYSMSQTATSHDIFKPLADYLQQVYWGNLDRRPLDTQQYGRIMEASESHFGMSFEELLTAYPDTQDTSIKLILHIAHLRPNLKKINWQALFHGLEHNHQQYNSKGVHDTVQLKRVRDTVQLIGQDVVLKLQTKEITADDLITLVDEMLWNAEHTTYDLMPVLNTVYGDEADLYYTGICNIGELRMESVRYSLVSLLTNYSLDIQANTIASDRRKNVEREAASRAQTELVEWYFTRFKTLGLNDSQCHSLLEGANIKRAKCILFNTINNTAFKELEFPMQSDFIQWIFSLSHTFEEKVFLQKALALYVLNIPLLHHFFIGWINDLIEKEVVPERLKKLSQEGFSILKKHLISLDEIDRLPLEKIILIFSKFGVEALEKKLISLEWIQILPSEKVASIFSEFGIEALEKKLISLEWIQILLPKKVTSILSEFGIKALQTKLINIGQLQTTPTEKVALLLSDFGIKALQNNMFTVEQIQSLSEKKARMLLRALTHAQPLLLAGTITIEQVQKMSLDKLSWLLTWQCINLIKKKLIQVQQVLNLSDFLTEIVLSWNGKRALESLLITLEQLQNMPEENAKIMLSDAGFNLLQENILSPELAQLLKTEQMELLVSKRGVRALKNGMISPVQAYCLSMKKLRFLLSDHGMNLLQSKLINFAQVRVSSLRVLKFLSKKNGIIALQEGLITPESLFDLTDWAAGLLLSNNGIQALRSRLISLKQAQCFPMLLSDDGITALRSGLVTPDCLRDLPGLKVQFLLSCVGVHALQQGLINIEAAHRMSEEQMTLICRTYWVASMKQSGITIDQIPVFTETVTKSLLTLNARHAIESGKLTVTQICTLNPELLHFLLPHGLSALVTNQISLEQLSTMNQEIVQIMIQMGPLFFNALKEKLFTMTDLFNLGTLQCALLLSPGGQYALKKKLILPIELVPVSEEAIHVALSKYMLSKKLNLGFFSSVEPEHIRRTQTIQSIANFKFAAFIRFWELIPFPYLQTNIVESIRLGV